MPALMVGCTTSDDKTTTTITVMAAASLTEPFTELAQTFEAQYPGVKVTLVFDGSSTLSTQLVEGAPADVFASASKATMTEVTDAGLITSPAVFTGNQLTIAVPADNPAKITSLADLATPGVTVVVCAPEVPCGALAASVIAASGLDITPVSEEQNVKAVVTKLTTGAADAGFVYLSDAKAEPGITAVGELTDATTDYYIGVLTGADPLASEFVALVRSSAGQKVLTDAGFSPVQP
ncbi:MAG: molybdate ABC transporter substrate-binding protein [Micrococcales bacterium]|nr:molybdate ABC transporter substrate-binding protein [Micrococcales bacterium]